MSDTLIKVEGVSKKFCRSLKRSLWYGMQDLGSELLGQRHSRNDQLRLNEFWAVKDVSFELKRGECLGLIGCNGAGKSTLLRMLNGLIKPDSGRIEMRGKIGALIALGAGFNPILSGRENIYVNASIIGLGKREIDKKIDEIIDFAELSEFIDMPVQNYSSGMQVRLGFAVASSLNPDILLLDEVMAVGDMNFAIKCFNRMDRLIKNTAVIFVSHSMPQVSRIASDVLLMERGAALVQGKGVAEGIDAYYGMVDAIPNFALEGAVSIETIAINGEPYVKQPIVVRRLEDLRISCRLQVAPEHRRVSLYLAFYNIEQTNVAEFLEDEPTAIVNRSGNVKVTVTIPRVNFSKGTYSLVVGINDLDTGHILMRIQSAAFFQVIGKRAVWSSFQLEGRLEQLP